MSHHFVEGYVSASWRVRVEGSTGCRGCGMPGIDAQCWGMSPRIPHLVRQAIIAFPDKPRRGDVTRFCAEHQISVAAFYKIRDQARRDGPESVVVARSTSPVTQAGRTPAAVEEQALAIRGELTRKGWDAGPMSVASEMRKRGLVPPSRATLARIFTRRGVVTPQPQKKPRAAFHRFRYPDPNGCWQLDGFNYKLDNGQSRCVLQVEDDHARFVLASHVAVSENADAAIGVVAEAIRRHGAPTFFLTDNGAAFNQSRRGRESRLERFLKRQGVTPISGRPGHPTTQGKNERLHQTLGKFLDANRPIDTTRRLAELVDQFDDYYNHQRPHQGLDHLDQTPAQAYQAKPKALPAPHPITTTPPPPKPVTDTATARTALVRAKRGPYRNYKGATPPGETPDTVREAERHVHSTGIIAICGHVIYVARSRAGQPVHVQFDDHTITVIDTDGVILGTTHRPPRDAPSRQRLRLTE